MDAIRKITQIENNFLTMEIPLSFKSKIVEVIVMPVDDMELSCQPANSKSRNRIPSEKTRGTKILGDIMSPVVPAQSWDAIQ